MLLVSLAFPRMTAMGGAREGLMPARPLAILTGEAPAHTAKGASSLERRVCSNGPKMGGADEDSCALRGQE